MTARAGASVQSPRSRQRGCRDPPTFSSQYPHQLSGGMCQRVLIAFAFSSNPRLVIADEPTTALDVTVHPPILRLIAEMQQQHGTAVIFITHDLRLAAQLCDQIVVMYAGRAIESGPARLILSKPAHPYTRCLQLANPTMHSPRRALYVMPDQMPSLRQLANMSGCHFAPRCPLVVANCRQAEPPNVAVANGHRVACIRATEVENIATTDALAATTKNSQRTVLQVDKLQKRYAIGDGLFGGARTVEAVKDASFSIAENEFVALVGESGSGKSTIAKLLVGLEQASGGRILLNGDDLTDPSLRHYAQRRECADGVSGSAIRAQSAAARRQHRDAGDGGWHPAHNLGGAARTDRGIARRNWLGGRFCRPAAWSIVGRAAPAREHRPRALQHSQGSDRRRDRFGARCVDPGAAAEFAGTAAFASSALPCFSFLTICQSYATCAPACW